MAQWPSMAVEPKFIEVVQPLLRAGAQTWRAAGCKLGDFPEQHVRLPEGSKKYPFP